MDNQDYEPEFDENEMEHHLEEVKQEEFNARHDRYLEEIMNTYKEIDPKATEEELQEVKDEFIKIIANAI
jgi:hypothetical protein